MNRKLNFLNKMEEMSDIRNYAYTKNGAIAYSTTQNPVLDAFGCLGSMKDASCKSILDVFYNALDYDKDMTMRLLFYIRDVRGGQGMRRVFRVIVSSLAYTYPNLVINNLDNFLFFGRGDDVLCLLDTPVYRNVINWIGYNIECDMMTVQEHYGCPSLLAKWLPSENASSYETVKLARKIRSALHMTPREYRKILTTLRNRIDIVETKMSSNRWDEIDFGKVPSRASMLYSGAFYKNAPSNYTKYIKELLSGDNKVNTGAIFPVDIVKKIIDNEYIKKGQEVLLDMMWKSLPNYFEGLDETGICCVDTSGSMYCGSGTLPIHVSISLGLYCADKCKGAFKGKFITFSSRPDIRTIMGETIKDKISNMGEINSANTNIEGVFDLILNTAIKNNSPQEDIPSKLYIISDMQFDKIKSGENKKPIMKHIREKYEKYGYKLPMIVYWNVSSVDKAIYQTKFDGEDCAVVSGYSPSLFRAVINGTTITTEHEEVVDETTGNVYTRIVEKEKLNPLDVMKTAIMNERYDRVFTGNY